MIFTSWQFKLLMIVWGDWGPSDMLLIGTYAGSKLAKTLPVRKRIVCWIVGRYLKVFVERV